MNRKEAGIKLRYAFAAMTVEQAENVRCLTEKGAGLLGLPDGATLSGPTMIAPAMRDVYANLIDALYDCDPGSGAEEWIPIRGGAWEDVILTLIIEGDWERIESVAADLRREEASRG